MTIVGTRALISYEGQPIICYGCNEPGHQYLERPGRKITRAPLISTYNTNSWANIVEQGAPKIQFEKRRKETGTAKNTVQMNSREEDRQREKMTPPRELWNSLITEETAHELEVGTQHEDTGMDTENIADTVERKGEERLTRGRCPDKKEEMIGHTLIRRRRQKTEMHTDQMMRARGWKRKYT
jgi:hypothetical protein